ncbi:MAG TPA: gliding motility-associated C-terminal domain-containing protein [Cytophagaceae bacterium]
MKFILQVLLVLAMPFLCFSEGTKQVEPGPNDQAKLTIGTETALNFSTFSSSDSNKIHLHIKDPATEKILLGFGFVFNSYAKNTRVPLYFRILSPSGSVLVAPTLVPTGGQGYIATKDQALNGANGLAGTIDGYDALVYTPASEGDYVIEFSLTPNVSNTPMKVYLEYYDFTVSANNKALPGRIWSYLWQFNNMSAQNRAYGKFFTYTPDSVVTSFVLNGMKPHGYSVMCNKYGKRSTNPGAVNFNATRQSVVIGVEDPRLNPAYAEYKIFLTDPDSLVYPSYKEPFKIKTLISVNSCANAADCQGIKIEVNKEVYTEIWIDINNNNIKDAVDTILSKMLVPGSNCLSWDFKDKKGTPLPPGSVIRVNAALYSGITNFPIFDPEENDVGILVKLIRPKYTASDDVKIYWDDTQLGRSRSSSFPLSSLDGCSVSGTNGCHKWDNLKYIPGFGDKALVNTWWYGFTFEDVKSFPIEEVPVANTNTLPSLCKKEKIKIGSVSKPNATYSWKALGKADLALLNDATIADPEVDLTNVSLNPIDSLLFERITTLQSCSVKDTIKILYKNSIKRLPVLGPSNVCADTKEVVISSPEVKDDYNWQIVGDGQIKRLSAKKDSIVVTFNQSGNRIKIKVEAKQSDGCPGDTGSISITKHGTSPYQKPSGPGLICFNNSKPASYEVSPSPHASYRWNIPANLGVAVGPAASNKITVLLKKNVQGYISYSRVDTIYLPQEAPMICSVGGDSVFVKNKGLEKILAGPDTTICAGDSAKLEMVQGVTNATWSPTLSNGLYAKPTRTTLYIAKSNDADCPNSDSITVNISALPGKAFSTQKINICFEDNDPNFSLAANVGFSEYDWSPFPGTGNTASIPKNLFTNDFETKTFRLTVRNELGCLHKDSISVRALCPPRVFIPKAFTPNSNETNDSLQIFGAHFKNFEMKIFNRWGEVIFRTTDRYKPWDGKYNGEDVPLGVYPWTVTYESLFEDDPENPRSMSGGITLIR